MGFKLIVTPRLVHGTNQRTFDTTHIVRHASCNHPSSSANKPCSNDFQRESSSTDVAATNSFVKLRHYLGALVSIYTGEEGMTITVKK